MPGVSAKVSTGHPEIRRLPVSHNRPTLPRPRGRTPARSGGENAKIRVRRDPVGLSYLLELAPLLRRGLRDSLKARPGMWRAVNSTLRGATQGLYGGQLHASSHVDLF